MKCLYFFAVVIAVMLFGGPAHAGQFDGPWSGSINALGTVERGAACPLFQGTLQMFVQNGTVLRGRAVVPK